MIEGTDEAAHQGLRRRDRRHAEAARSAGYDVVRLYVNVDHVATLRQQRGTRYPDPVAAAALCELAGADGITVHLREDRRHIQDRDVRVLRETVRGVSQPGDGRDRRDAAHRARGEARLLHAGAREARGADDRGRADGRAPAGRWRRSCAALADAGIGVSLFIDPEPRTVEASAALGADDRRAAHGRLLPGAAARSRGRAPAPAAGAGGARGRRTRGCTSAAGHGLDYSNVGPVAALAELEELNIGHGLVARAVMIGMQRRRERAARRRSRRARGVRGTCRRCLTAAEMRAADTAATEPAGRPRACC